MILANTKKRIFTSLILFSVILIIFKFNQVLLYFLLIFSILSILEFLNLTKKIFNKRLYFILSNFLFITYLSIFSSTFFYLSNFLDSKIILYAILLTCIASDLGGFVFGKFFKGPKLTKISPNKTFSGAIGSLIFSCIIFCFIFFFFFEKIQLKFIIIAIIISLGCQIGDLFFSYLKRKAKLKDTGNFLPGHGGILDRLDGIFLGIPVGLIIIIFFV